jgi:STE24 endopeptidase
MSAALTWLFLAALAAASATRLWLARRQMRPVAAHRDAVPPSFAGSIRTARPRTTLWRRRAWA